MEENNRNLFLVVVLSVLVLAVWQYFIAGPAMKAEQARQTQLAHEEKAHAQRTAPSIPGEGLSNGHLSRHQALSAAGPRIVINTPTVDGSLLLKGARFDDLRLKKYRETVDPKSPEIVLLAPKNTDFPYYADFGWIGDENHLKLPDESASWREVDGGDLTPGHPVTLEWDNGAGLTFSRRIAVDDKYMFTIQDSVRNASRSSIALYPYASVAREGVPTTTHYWVLHEGFVGVADGSLKDASYDDFKKDDAPPNSFSSKGGWAGITDKYWMAAVVPPQSESFDGEYRATKRQDGVKVYWADYRLGQRNLAPQAQLTVTHKLFAGAKVVDILRTYEHRDGIARFDLAVDWGWFIFITQPLFWVLDQLVRYLGNFGLAILALTVFVKGVTFPIANASAKTMAKMKKVQPEMERIKERFKDDPTKQQQSIMELYRREKVNPLTGCLPQLLVIPVFFSLYKVFFVTIEMYHQPFYGWIRDLSAPDPTSILNLFGLLPYHIPSFVPAYFSVGAWPIMMGITQWVQTKLNPPAADPVQQRMFSLMPIIFTFMFSTFASGLVIYYAWNNLLTIAQQMVIMRSQNVPIHLIDNFRWPDFVARWRMRLLGAKPEPGE